MPPPEHNGHDRSPPRDQLLNPAAREKWGVEHDLPPGFVIVTKSELLFIQERTQLAMFENLKYRAAARLFVGSRTVEEFLAGVAKLKRDHDVMVTELRRRRAEDMR